MGLDIGLDCSHPEWVICTTWGRGMVKTGPAAFRAAKYSVRSAQFDGAVVCIV